MNKKKKYFLTFIFMSYGCSISILISDESRNYLAIFAGFLSFAITLKYSSFIKRDFPWNIPLITYMLIVSFWTDSYANYLSVTLTFIYSMGYYAVACLASQSWCDRNFITSLFEKLIYAYAIVSLIQLLCSLVGLPIPNLMSVREGYSLNSLALEPSHLARILGITFIAYLRTKKIEFNNNNFIQLIADEKKILTAFLVTMLLSGSTTAIIAIPISVLFSYKINRVIPIMIPITIMIVLVSGIEYEPIQRAVAFVPSLFTFDAETITKTDHSGALRVLPALIYLDTARPTELSFWLGYGPDGIAQFFQEAIKGVKDYAGHAGLVPGFAVIYGIFGNILFFWTFLFNYRLRRAAPIMIFFIIFYFASPLNTPLLWYGLIVFSLVFEALNKPLKKFTVAVN